jgi:hypothetical protein
LRADACRVRIAIRNLGDRPLPCSVGIRTTGETRMSNEKRSIALPTLLAFTIAGMAFTASLVLAYYATHPDRIGR